MANYYIFFNHFYGEIYAVLQIHEGHMGGGHTGFESLPIEKTDTDLAGHLRRRRSSQKGGRGSEPL